MDLSFFDVASDVKRIGHYQWLEQRLFQIMGALAGEVDDPEATFLVGSQSYHHEFLADLWSKRLTQLGGDSSAVSAPVGPFGEQLVSGSWQAQPASAQLGCLYRTILPRVAHTYAQHLAGVDEMLLGATARVLKLAGSDYRSDWVEGEFLVQKFLSSADQISETLETQKELEMALGAGPGLILTHG